MNSCKSAKSFMDFVWLGSGAEVVYITHNYGGSSFLEINRVGAYVSLNCSTLKKICDWLP